MRDALEGHLPAASPLSPRRAFESLSPLARALVRYTPDEPWELDTRTLPAPLARYRTRLRRFAETHVAPVADAIDVAPHASAPSPATMEVLRAACREGFLSDMLPQPFGSASPRMITQPLSLAACMKTEELATVDGGLMLTICAHSLGVAPILLSGDLGAIRRFVVPSCRDNLAGDPHVIAFAITEPAAGSDVEEGHGASLYRPGVTAHRADGGFRLNGRKCFISGGDLARETVVFAALHGEGVDSWTAFVVPATARGFRVTRTELKMGMRASGAAEIELDDVFVPDDRVLGGLRKGWALNRATLNLSRLPVAAMGVGFARGATDAAIDFACRTRLGRKCLVDYQEVQIALADMLAETQAARAMVWEAARRTQPLQREASAAKFFCTDVALRVCTRAMDLLGNHAVLHRERVERAWRDARLTQIFEGTNQINRLAVVEDVQEHLVSIIARLQEER